jgi:cell division protein FtsB
MLMHYDWFVGALTKSEPIKQATNLPRIVAISIVALVIIALIIWQYSYQQQRITALNESLTSATKNNVELKSTVASLAAKNSNLEGAVKLLQSQITTSKTQTTNSVSTSPAPQAAGKLTINSVTTAQISTYQSPTNAWPYPSIPATAVNVTLQNLTTSNQRFDISQFGAITDAGVVVHTLPWTPNISQTPWISTEVIPGASIKQTIYFSPGQNLVTMTWQPPGGTVTLSASLPSQ